MTGHERGGGVSKVEQRTARLAVEYGTTAAAKARQFLINHMQAGRISESQALEIMAAEKEAAEAKFRAEREVGLHNDLASLGAGLTATLTKSGKERLEYQMKLRGVPFDLNAPSFDELPVLGGHSEESLYQMTLPTGMYTALKRDENDQSTLIEHPYQITFFTTSRQIASNVSWPLEPNIIAPKFDVIRIESVGGDLWQNPDYTPEGQPSGRGPAPVDL
jgi:hypothetical protein